MTEEVVTTGATRHPKLQSNHHYQQTNTQLLKQKPKVIIITSCVGGHHTMPPPPAERNVAVGCQRLTFPRSTGQPLQLADADALTLR